MSDIKTELQALATATCRTLGVRTQQELDASIKPPFPIQNIQSICKQLQTIELVTKAFDDPEWDNIFAIPIQLDLKYSTPANEQVLLNAHLSQVTPIACLRWMVTDSHSAFAELDPPLKIIVNYTDPVPAELQNVAPGVRDILRCHGYITVQPADLDFIVSMPAEETADARRITGASFFFGWDFLRK